MSPFIIFVIILTVAYVLYYIAMITIDLNKSNKDGESKSEIIDNSGINLDDPPAKSVTQAKNGKIVTGKQAEEVEAAEEEEDIPIAAQRIYPDTIIPAVEVNQKQEPLTVQNIKPIQDASAEQPGQEPGTKPEQEQGPETEPVPVPVPEETAKSENNNEASKQVEDIYAGTGIKVQTDLFAERNPEPQEFKKNVFDARETPRISTTEAKEMEAEPPVTQANELVESMREGLNKTTQCVVSAGETRSTDFANFLENNETEIEHQVSIRENIV